MTAKEELRQIYSAQRRIKRMQSRRKAIAETMYDLRSPIMTKDKVQTSLTGDKMANLIAELEDLDNEIIDGIQKLTELQTAIIRKIESMADERQKDVLYSRYVEMKKWELIAVEMDYTMRNLFVLHGHALIEYEKL